MEDEKIEPHTNDTQKGLIMIQGKRNASSLFTAAASLALTALAGPSAMADSNRICADSATDSCYLAGNFPPSLLQSLGITDEMGLAIRYHQGQWYMNDQLVASFGFTSWTPLVGDWDGDGYDNLGYFKNGIWVLKSNWDFTNVQSGVTSHFFGDSTWTPIAGDWDNNGTDTLGLYKDGTFRILLNSNDPASETNISFGNLPYDPTDAAGPHPIVGSFDGAGDRVGIIEGTVARHAWHSGAATYDFYNPLPAGLLSLVTGTAPVVASDMRPIVVDGYDPNDPNAQWPRLMFSRKVADGSPRACPVVDNSTQNEHCYWLILDDDRPDDGGRTDDPDPEIF